MNRIIYCIGLVLLFAFSVLYSQSKGGRWEFENNGNDTATWDLLNDNGVLQNQASLSSMPPLQQGNVYLWLDSSNVFDFFKVENSDDLDFDNENVGISAWIYPLVINDVHYLVNKGIQDANPKTTNYAIRISPDLKLEFLIRDANNQAQRVTSDFIIAENQWTFVAAFYDYSAGIVYMWNEPTAQPVDTLNFTRDFFSNNDPLSIGSWARNDPNSPSIKDFQGRIDDVRISGRVGDILPGPAAINNTPEQFIATFVLHQNYPNPFNPSTIIPFDIAESETVRLRIYDTSGKHIKTLLDESLSPGHYTQIFNASQLASGLYFYRLETRKKTLTRKMLLLR
jgi:hypothetical protein